MSAPEPDGTQPLSTPPTSEMPQQQGLAPAPYASQPNQPIQANPFGQVLPDHPQAMTVLVLGIVSLVAFQPLGPVAWYMGNQALREIDAQPGRWDHRDYVNIGRILGIVSTVLLALFVAFFVVFIVIYAGIFAVLLGTS